MKKRLILGMSFAVCILLTARANADKLYMTDGTVKVVKSIKWQPSASQYIIEMDNGASLPVDKAKVARVEVAKPVNYDKAVQLAASNPNEAIPLFQGIVSAYQMLGWDNKARDYLGQIYTKKKDSKNAADVYKSMFRTALPAEITPAMQKRYQDALLATGDFGTLQKEIDNAIAVGSRENAALAQITRGDMYRKQGKNFDALMDYLKTVILFRKVEEAQPEALYKAAQCLEELRDPRAEMFRNRLAQDYPQSEWTAKLK
jgi:tetratricopeptide (TPR) repeat protein